MDCDVECGKEMIRKSFLTVPGSLRHVPRINKVRPKTKQELADEFNEETEYMKTELNNRCSFLLHAPEGKIVEMNVFKGLKTFISTIFPSGACSRKLQRLFNSVFMYSVSSLNSSA